MATHSLSSGLAVTVGFGMAACATWSGPPQPPRTAPKPPTIVIQSYGQGLAGVHAANPDVKVRIGRGPALADGPILLVEYPPATDDPAARDIWLDAENSDWTTGHAISFQIKSVNPERLSVSFLDRNRVVYTTWINLHADAWQPVRILFDQLRPNPYFQPPDAKTGGPLDLSNIKGIAFAPQNQPSGRLAVSRFIVTE